MIRKILLFLAVVVFHTDGKDIAIKRIEQCEIGFARVQLQTERAKRLRGVVKESDLKEPG